MPYIAFATDYDGTIARDGHVDEPTIAALERARAGARRIILVTGRELPDLRRVMPRLDVFDAVVAENGALLYLPGTKQERVLAPPPDPSFVARLRALRVDPLSVGRSIVATWEPNEAKVLRAIHELGLELTITFNKGAVMVLPAGINKASGLQAALEQLRLSPFNFQMAEGIDEETWQWHRERGDYSRWFASSIKDHDLAAKIAEIESGGAQASEVR